MLFTTVAVHGVEEAFAPGNAAELPVCHGADAGALLQRHDFADRLVFDCLDVFDNGARLLRTLRFPQALRPDEAADVIGAARRFHWRGMRNVFTVSPARSRSAFMNVPKSSGVPTATSTN